MPYARPHQLLSLSGSHFGVDRWTIGFRLNNVGGTFPATAAAQQALCDSYASAVSTWMTSNAIIGNQSKLDLVKLNAIGIDGKYVNGFTIRKDVSPVVSSSSASSHAPQVSLVATLLTGIDRGLASKGRVFLPSPVFAVGATTGQMTTSLQTDAVARVKALIDAINAVDSGRVVVVASNTRSGAERSVKFVGVGLVLDTMRTRRSKMAETRVQSAVAGAPF